MASRLRMPAQIGEWLAELRGSEPAVAVEVGAALMAVLDAQQLPGPPLVTDPDDPDADDRDAVLDRAYRHLLDRLQVVRRMVADAGSARGRAELLLAEEAANVDTEPAALRVFARRVRRARQREEVLSRRSSGLQHEVELFQMSRETWKARMIAARAGQAVEDALRGEVTSAGKPLTPEQRTEMRRLVAKARRLRRLIEAAIDDSQDAAAEAPRVVDPTAANESESTATSEEADLTMPEATIRRYSPPSQQGEPATGPPPAPASEPIAAHESVSAAEPPTQHHAPADPEPESGHGPAPEADPEPGEIPVVLELHADPLGADIRLIFAVEPPGTVTLLTVLESAAAVQDSHDDAIEVAAELLAEVRAGDSTHDDEDWREFAGPGEFAAEYFAGEMAAINDRAAALATASSLAALRHRRGFSLTELAAATGTSEKRVRVAETEGVSRLHDLAAYVRALGGAVDAIADIEGERFPLT